MTQSTPGPRRAPGKTLWQLVVERAELTPDKQMARDGDGRTLTYAQYRDWCERAAAGYAAMGVAEGSVVSWVLPSTFEAVVTAGALSRLGAVQNPILPIYRHREVAFITKQCGAMLLITPSTFRGFDFAAMADEIDVPATLVVDDVLPEGDPATLAPYRPAFEDLRWIFYSSGTTSDPKGAKHYDRTLSAANDGMQWSMEVSGDDRAAIVFPITHVGGLVWLFNTMQTGVELLMVESFDPAGTPRWLSANGCTCAGAGTAFFLMYLNAQRNAPDGTRILPDVRIFNGGGAPKPDSLHGQLMSVFGAPLINGWGLTESPINTMIHLDDPDEKKSTTDGRACGGAQLRTVLDGEETPAGTEGELQVHGPQVCAGYVDSTLDAEAFTADGWFRTGDLGVIDEDGFVRITGRLKDIIIRKGENISAKEIEDLLYTHPAIADVAVVGLPADDARGELACAVVVFAEGQTATLDELTTYLRDHQLSSHKLPEQLEVVDSLPRNPTGKILKKDLRSTYGGEP